MSFLTIVILAFSLIGAIDYILGNRFGIGNEFKKAFELFCPMALSMLGMIVLAPQIGLWLTPIFDKFYSVFGVDPSIIPASLFANDMGGMALSQAVCKDETLGSYNAFIVSSMMGCVISFTIPFSIGIVKPEQHNNLFFGFLCGIITIPIGCFVAGLVCGIKVVALIINLLPLIILSVIVGFALVLVPKICIKCFWIFGIIMKTLSIIGLVLSIFTFLTKIEISPHFDTFENAAFICANACVTLSGMLPLMFIVSKLLNKPLNNLGAKIGINGVSTLSLLACSVTNSTVFGVMDKMDKKGVMLNSAFAVSAAFTFGGHLAFTIAFDSSYVTPMIIGKLISGICAVVLALIIYKDEAPANT